MPRPAAAHGAADLAQQPEKKKRKKHHEPAKLSPVQFRPVDDDKSLFDLVPTRTLSEHGDDSSSSGSLSANGEHMARDASSSSSAKVKRKSSSGITHSKAPKADKSKGKASSASKHAARVAKWTQKKTKKAKKHKKD